MSTSTALTLTRLAEAQRVGERDSSLDDVVDSPSFVVDAGRAAPPFAES